MLTLQPTANHYVSRAVDEYGYSTLTWDRLGVGESSKGDPLAEIQIFLEIEALYELTRTVRKGKGGNICTSFEKVVHIGHSFGSSITNALANTFPDGTDGIVLTGFSQVSAYVGYFALGGNFIPVTDIPALSHRYPAGPGDFDPALLHLAFRSGEAASPGEILTIGAGEGSSNAFSGPVLLITGERDIPFCGGNCLATSAINGSASNLIVASKQYFENASPFNATVVPNAGHGLNLGYSHSITYATILDFLDTHV
ncbi:hypothetical protein EIK77_009785 [Talaromyces pinophilus]|nr:hypothetical protein EIK77_009785 [Talaromyces pinophilus]